MRLQKVASYGAGRSKTENVKNLNLLSYGRMNEMSMRDYSVHDFGYVFNEKMIDKFIEKLKPKNIEPGDTYEMAELMGLEYIGDFTGDALRLDEFGDDDFDDDAWSYSGESIFYLPIGAYSSLFKAAYQSPEELARCMRSTYPKWLPDDLDDIYKGIRHTIRTSFG